MKYYHDKIDLNKNMSLNIFDGTGYPSKEDAIMHNHDCLELNYVCDGSGTYYIGDQYYNINTGDLFIINNCEYHSAVNSAEGLTLKVIVFDPEIIWSANNDLDYKYLKTFFEWKCY